MKTKCNFKFIFGVILSALIFVSCADEEIVSNDKLEFNNVLNFSYKTEIKAKNQLVATLTVPENKVWKIETATVYIDDNYSTPVCYLYMNEHVLYQYVSQGSPVTNKPYLVSGSYKLTVNDPFYDSNDYAYSALSIIEYNIK